MHTPCSETACNERVQRRCASVKRGSPPAPCHCDRWGTPRAASSASARGQHRHGGTWQLPCRTSGHTGGNPQATSPRAALSYAQGHRAEWCNSRRTGVDRTCTRTFAPRRDSRVPSTYAVYGRPSIKALHHTNCTEKVRLRLRSLPQTPLQPRLLPTQPLPPASPPLTPHLLTLRPPHYPHPQPHASTGRVSRSRTAPQPPRRVSQACGLRPRCAPPTVRHQAPQQLLWYPQR